MWLIIKSAASPSSIPVGNCSLTFIYRHTRCCHSNSKMCCGPTDAIQRVLMRPPPAAGLCTWRHTSCTEPFHSRLFWLPSPDTVRLLFILNSTSWQDGAYTFIYNRISGQLIWDSQWLIPVLRQEEQAGHFSSCSISFAFFHLLKFYKFMIPKLFNLKENSLCNCRLSGSSTRDRSFEELLEQTQIYSKNLCNYFFFFKLQPQIGPTTFCNNFHSTYTVHSTHCFTSLAFALLLTGPFIGSYLIIG